MISSIVSAAGAGPSSSNKSRSAQPTLITLGLTRPALSFANNSKSPNPNPLCLVSFFIAISPHMRSQCERRSRRNRGCHLPNSHQQLLPLRHHHSLDSRISDIARCCPLPGSKSGNHLARPNCPISRHHLLVMSSSRFPPGYYWRPSPIIGRL